MKNLGKRLITRRSRVQIPPPLRAEALALQGLPACLGVTSRDVVYE